MNPLVDRKIRFGLLGCGRIAKNHAQALKDHAADVELVAVCDNDPVALRRFTEDTGAPGFESASELLRSPQFDVLIIATPSGLHSQQTISAAECGLHVITEKPMATRWQDGKRMVAACDEAGVRLFVVKQNRTNPPLQALKKAIERGRFGRIYMVTVNVFWTRPQEYYDSAKWRGTWEFDGGALMNQASHYVDLLDWLMGPVESVQAYAETLARDIEVEDTAVMSVRWRSGALGTLNATMLTYPRNLEGSITVLGERGSVRIGGVALNEIAHWDFADAEVGDASVRESNYATDSVYGYGHSRYYANVTSALRGTSDAATDGREGLKSLELLIAAYLSARDGRRVSLPLEY